MSPSHDLARPSLFRLRLVMRAGAGASLLALGLLAACGGKQIGSNPDGGSGGGGGSGGSGSDGGVFTEPDGEVCVDIDVSTYDQSCNQDTDCFPITPGQICACACGGAAANVSEETRYHNALSNLNSTGICDCTSWPDPVCFHHTCTLCLEPGSCNNGESDGGVSRSDATVPLDATSGSDATASCVDINLKDFDQTCKSSAECISITSGEVCSGQCACGGSTINKSGEAKYESEISGIVSEDCPCVADGIPECVSGTCVLCGGPHSPPGCPDGG
jgi:hypothetical protein